MKMFRSHLLLCSGTGCHASGSLNVKKALVAELLNEALRKRSKSWKPDATVFCAMGPIMVVYPEGVIYMQIKSDDIPELVEEHLVKGRILQRLLYRETDDGRSHSHHAGYPVFRPSRTAGLEESGVD